MRLIRKDQIQNPFIGPTKEVVFEMIGGSSDLGGAKYHSLGHVVIPPCASSRLHYHPVAEETYYILRGEARMIIGSKEYKLAAGDAILIQPSETHQIFCEGEVDLEFLVICAPPWDPENSVYLD